MCLLMDKEVTDAVRQGQWPLTAYKALKWDFARKEFVSPYNQYTWKAGVNLSNRTAIEKDHYDVPTNVQGGQFLPEPTTEINRGIHVYLRADDAHGYDEYEHVIVQVLCYQEDFVAANAQQAVFMKVSISEEEWARAVAEASKLPEPEDEDDFDDYDDYDDGWDDWDEGEEDDWEEEEDDWDDDCEDEDLDEEEDWDDEDWEDD